MKKYIICLLLIICIISSFSLNLVFAKNIEKNIYTEDGKIKVFCLYPNNTIIIELPEMYIPTIEFIGADGKYVEGTIVYPNIDDITIGDFDLQYIFTPNDDKYETVTGYIKYYIYPEDDEISKGKIMLNENDNLKDNTSPSLTATKIILTDETTTFDININDKIEGSSYKWTSSNKKVAKVNSKGVVTPITKGKTTITCEITLPDYTKQVLTSEVIIGVDEDTPVLSENDIEIEVGEKFTIKVENLIKGSKISWKSADKKIARVSSGSGKVTGVKEGETYLICTITNGTEVVVLKCNVTVTK